MANTNVSHGEVVNICNQLEKSPSKNNSKSSPIYHGGSKGSSHSHGKVGTGKSKFGHAGVTGGEKRTNHVNKKDPYSHGH